ncbi:MAG: hypothetical protein H7175_27595 [Burkholderiales bacterium]|nr:hypothetical protein [Anaerolineae bacterium]
MMEQYEASPRDVFDTVINALIAQIESNGGLMSPNIVRIARWISASSILLFSLILLLLTQTSVPNLAQPEVAGIFRSIDGACCNDVTITFDVVELQRSGYIDSDLLLHFDEASFREQMQVGDPIFLTFFVDPRLRLFGDSSIDPLAGVRSADDVYLAVDTTLQAVEGPLDWMTVLGMGGIVVFLLLIVPDFLRLLSQPQPDRKRLA